MEEGKNLLVTGIIDIGLWDRATWRATVVASAGNSAPLLGLAYEDKYAGRKIFEKWHQMFGSKDKYEEIHVSIIEGDIPGEEPGYTVHINSSTENIVRRLKENNMEADESLVMTVGRFNRMNPQPGSKNLETFKQEFAKYGCYKLIPAYITKDMKIEIYPELAIEKHQIFFRDSTEIDETDIDYVVFKRNV